MSRKNEAKYFRTYSHELLIIFAAFEKFFEKTKSNLDI